MLPLPEGVETIERIRPGAKALIVRDGKVLVVHEKVLRNGEEVVISDFPGGGIENGETLEEALIREVYEEIGLQVKSEGLIGAWEFVVTNDQDRTKGVHIICLGYHCSLVGDAQVDTTQNPAEEDIFEAVWLTPEEILEQGEAVFEIPGFLDTVRALQTKLGK